MADAERRCLKDRRKKPTAAFSRFTFSGRRESLGRRRGEQTSGYVDRYSPKLLGLLIFIAGLNVLDAFLTMMILETNGEEWNPIVQALINLTGSMFWIWKFVLVSFCLFFICLHHNFRYVRFGLISITSIYAATVIYEVILISLR